MPTQPHRVHQPAITVSHLEAALRFYTEILPFRPVRQFSLTDPALPQLLGGEFGGPIRVAELRLGEEAIQLWHYPEQPGRSVPAASRSNDAWFQHVAIVVTDMTAAYAALEGKVTEVSRGPQRLPASLPHAAGIEAFYFNDPDGHVLELIYFPAGKGDPRWQSADLPLFAGIDHTAIGTDRTDEALHVYQDLLGLQLAGQGINYGEEQSRLNNVPDARLLISTLQAERGIGLELLDYLRPGTGRPYPADSQPWDLWHWHTPIQVADARAVYDRLRAAGHRLISADVVALAATALGVSRGFLVRDPSGHALLIYET